MSQQWILALLLQCECLLIRVMSSPETFRIPPSGIFMSLFTLKPEEGAALPDLDTILVRGGDLNPYNLRCSSVKNKAIPDHRSLCLWTGSDQHLSLHEDYQELRRNVHSVLPSNIHPAEQSWNLLCWRGENISRVTCEIRSVISEANRNDEIQLNLYYAKDNSRGERRGADCKCRGDHFCECDMSTSDGAYILWLEIVTPISPLLSPPISIDTSAILKPVSPYDLRMEITSNGKLKVVWWHPSPAAARLQYQLKHYFNTSDGSSQPSSLMTAKTFVILDVVESCTDLVFEVRCRTFPPIGVWSDWSQPVVYRSQDGFYFPQTLVVSRGSSISVYCTFCQNDKKVPAESINWGRNLAEAIPSPQYTAASRYVGKVTLANGNATKPKGKFGYDALYCCTAGSGCQPRYAKIYVIDVNINITCEAGGNVSAMTCRWSTLHMDSLKDCVFTFRYYDDYSFCLEKGNVKYNRSSEMSCTLQKDGYYQCVFSKIKAIYSYYMWVDIHHPEGRLQSTPFCVRPIDVVRPFSPSVIQAEMMVGTGYLHVMWKPSFAAFDVIYQLCYRVDAPKSEWTVLDVNNNESTTIKEVDSSKSYLVQVRCRKSDSVAEYWSHWSRPVRTVIKDIKAPLKGPEFWRIVKNNLLQEGDNITLIWQPSLNSYLKYEVLYETSSMVMAPVDVGNATNYTFTLQNYDVTVSVGARNSLGHSKMNHKLTFSPKISTVQAVESLDVYLLNNSVVALWTLLPVEYNVVELVLEWRNLRYESSGRWVFISPNVSRYYIEEHFFAVEKYQFSLTPVFLKGVGSPKIAYEFSKEEPAERQKNTGFYVILPAITVSSFLLVITLAISHQRMKKMFWKDVPNPKYCSWAQGVNFQKIH